MTELPRELYNDPYAQRILLNFLEENEKNFDVYEFAFYWLKTGHVFLLFQGRMKRAHDTFDRFLDFTSEGENHARSIFEMYDMGKQMGVVEEIFENALSVFAESHEAEKKKDKESSGEDGEDVEADEADKKAEKRDRNTERNMRIKPLLLIVEDERMTQSFVKALTEPYCDVIVADTVLKGRTLYQEHWPNIVFMDINLPDGDGQELTAELHGLDSESYIVIVSANISKEKIQKCEDSGAKGFIAKPVTKDKARLLSMIHQYNLERR